MEIIKNNLHFDRLFDSWRSQNFDSKLVEYKPLIYPDLSADQIMSIGPHFIYIFDCSTLRFHYLSRNVNKVIGYNHEFLVRKGADFLDKIVHHEDMQFVYESLRKSWRFVISKPDATRKAYSISFDFRIQKYDGQYVRILQQNKVLNLDRKGNILYILGICTDITHWHKDNHLSLTIVGPEEEQNFCCISPSNEPSYREKLSNRQKQILQLLSEGFCSREISEKLHISQNTVNVHRRNMLERLNLHNTNSLIKFAISHRII